MNNKVLVIAALFLWCVQLGAYNAQETFLKANKLYDEGDLAQACLLYESMPHKGPAVLINLGVCYYHQKRMPEALLCWYRARRMASRREHDSIMRCQRMVEQPAPVTSRWLSLQQFIEPYAWKIPPLFAQLLFLFVWLGFLLLLVWLVRRALYGVTCLLVVLLIVISILAYSYYRIRTQHLGIPKEQTTALRSGPDARYSTRTTIGLTAVELCGERDGWYKVRYGGLIGWTPADTIMPVDEQSSAFTKEEKRNDH